MPSSRDATDVRRIRTEQSTDASKEKLPLPHIVAGIAICAVIVLAFAWYVLLKPAWNYHQEFVDKSFMRVFPALADIRIDDLFTPALKRQYINGKGLRITLITKERGEPDKTDPPKVVLEPFERFDEKPAPERNQEIDRAKAKLGLIVGEFNAPAPPRYIDLIIFADNTTGNQLRADLVDRWYQKLGVESALGEGRWARLRFHQISDKATTIYDPPPLEVPPKPDSLKYQADILSSLKTVFAPTNTAYSLIATGMFNALRADSSAQPIDHYTHILLFSDLHENDPSTLSFEGGAYANPVRLAALVDDPARRRDLESKMQAVVECPLLNGAHVFVYFPPTEPGDRYRRMPLLFRLWSEIFSQHGAGAVDFQY